jgi:tetratricopeptide (TPR) repeat protein
MNKQAWLTLFGILIVLYYAYQSYLVNNRYVGACAEKNGDYRKAIDRYTENLKFPSWLEGENEHPWGRYIERANCYYKIGEYQKALQDYDSALREYEFWEKVPLVSSLYKLPNNIYGSASIYRERGHVKFVLHQYDAAIADYNESIARSPTNSLSYLYRSEAYDRTGQHALAKKDLDRRSSNQFP